VFDYLYHSMRDLKKEIFKVMFLDSQNGIVQIEDLFEGTLNASAIYPREVIQSAVKHNAAALIFVHNHPAGNPQPSENDKQITRELVFAGNIMQIKVLDHIIIGDNRYFSFADAGLIEEYNSDFLTLREGAKH
jgi:DNA repair protein RadC